MDVNPWGFVHNSAKVRETLNGLTYGTHLNHFIFENNQIVDDDTTKFHLQGVLNLVDNLEEDGGFQIVPGFKNHFQEWLDLFEGTELHKTAEERNTVNFSEKDPLQRFAIRIPMREGSMVVWDQRSPHGTVANNSSRIRSAQFIKMFPALPMDPNRAIARSSTVQISLGDHVHCCSYTSWCGRLDLIQRCHR